MASIGDVIQISVKARNLNNVVIRNVFYYMLMDAPTVNYLGGLATEFQSAILAKMAATQPSDYVIEELIFTNLFAGDVLNDSTPTPAIGTRSVAGERAPSFLAAQVLLTRENTRVRHGKKFFNLPMESDTIGDAISPATLTLLNTLAGALDSSLNPGGVDVFEPIIVGRVLYTTPSGRTAYRLPTSALEMGDRWSLIAPCRVIQRATTMNSRKFWRGE